MTTKLINKLTICAFLIILFPLSAAVKAQDADGIGQTIQIYTQLHSFKGHPTWLLIVRDIDHDQNIPYVYDFTKGDNFWLALTYGRNYMITVSELQFNPYRTNPYRMNPYIAKKISNFCHLESRGRILRGESVYIVLKGDLTANTDSYTCEVSHYKDANFTVTAPNTK